MRKNEMLFLKRKSHFISFFFISIVLTIFLLCMSVCFEYAFGEIRDANDKEVNVT